MASSANPPALDPNEDESVGILSGDEESHLPKTTVQRIIQEILPEGFAISQGTRNLIQECTEGIHFLLLEFIRMVTAEANSICVKEGRKTISPEHLCTALRDLGFEDYVLEVRQASQAWSDASEEKAKRHKAAKQKLKDTGLSVEELERQQEELFRQARERMNSVNSEASNK